MRFLALLLACLPLSATVTYDASTLLTQAYADQFGEGDLAWAHVYVGDPSDPFALEAASDGQGRTFTELQALACTDGQQCLPAEAFMSSYNPQNWAPLDAGGMSLAFNLTDSRIARELLGPGNDDSQSQIYNEAGLDSIFEVDSTLVLSLVAAGAAAAILLLAGTLQSTRSRRAKTVAYLSNY